ncbi:MAG: ketoacyl-ACP synthase III, partial [Clostridiales bacterium]|nr:ketoacyl-ACP synthase III [Clostridiales bacterium]
MKILGTGSVLPKKIVTNDDVAQVVDTSDEWIRSRTGIVKRHIAVDETTTSMSLEASKIALEAANVRGEDLDLIIGATVSPDFVFPTLGCELQAELGAVGATAFDVGAGCSGFMYAMATADAYFRTGRYKMALIVGAEVLSKIMDWTDRTTCVLFGDGAGAAVVSADGDQLLAMAQGSDGTGGPALCLKNREVSNMCHPLGDQTYTYTHMDGSAVYKFAVRTVPGAVKKVLGEADVAIDDVKLFILHQANRRIIESVAKHLGQPIEKFPMSMQECGNTSAASIPVLLDELVRDGSIQKGDKIVLAGFGAGLTWAACVIEW